MTALEAYALAKKIAISAVSGIANLSVNGTTLTIETNDGNTLDMVFPTPADGRGIAKAEVNSNDHLIITYDDGVEEDAGLIKGSDVQVTQLLNHGIKIAKIKSGDITTDIFAPEGGSGGGNFFVIDKIEELPEDLTEDDRQVNFCIEDSNFYLWDGIKWSVISAKIKIRELTEEEYNALTTEEQMNGTIYFVTDEAGGGGSGGATQKVITSSVDLGGIEKNDSFPIGTSYDDMWDQLLNPLITPVLTDPSVSLSYTLDNNGYYKVGATVTARTATLTYNAGSIVLDGVKQNNRGGAATRYSILTTGADTEYSDSSDSSGLFTVPALTRTTKGTIKITGTVSYAAGPQPKDSKGGDYDSPLAAGSKSANKTLNFIQPYYYGVSNSGTISDFTGLTEAVSAKGNKTYNFTTNNQYMVFAYDSSYGNLKNILDPNSFETISGWNKTTVTVDGFSYYVYVSKSPTTDTNAAFTFKY